MHPEEFSNEEFIRYKQLLFKHSSISQESTSASDENTVKHAIESEPKDESETPRDIKQQWNKERQKSNKKSPVKRKKTHKTQVPINEV